MPTLLAWALGLGESEKAEEVLVKVVEENGPSFETYGLLGRVYKDRWQAARKDNALLAPVISRMRSTHTSRA